LIANENFIIALVIYFKIIEKYFVCNTDISTSADASMETLEGILFDNVRYPGIYSHVTASNNAFNNKIAINSILDGNFSRSRFGDSFSEKMASASNFDIDNIDRLFNFSQITDEEFIDVCINQVGISGFKNISSVEHTKTIKNNIAGWSFLDNSTASQHMSDEINRLRRLVNEQQKEILRLSK